MEEKSPHFSVDMERVTKSNILQFQKLVEEIESNKGKALLVLQKQTELQLSDTDRSPRNPDKLAKEINQLQAIAREQCATLKEAVLQQELYEGDLQTLTAAINDAQDKLLASPVNPSDVDSLKKQIAEHNVCTSTAYRSQTHRHLMPIHTSQPHSLAYTSTAAQSANPYAFRSHTYIA